MGAAGSDPGQRQHARTLLLAQAEAAAKPATWIRGLAAFPEAPRAPLSPAAARAVAMVAVAHLQATTAPKAEAAIEKMLAGLQQRTPRSTNLS